MNNTEMYAELRGRIRTRFKTQAAFAKAIGLSLCSVNKKLNGATEWTADEIRKACEILHIKPEDISHLFFYPER